MNVSVVSSYIQVKCLKYKIEWNLPKLHVHASPHYLVGATSWRSNLSVCVSGPRLMTVGTLTHLRHSSRNMFRFFFWRRLWMLIGWEFWAAMRLQMCLHRGYTGLGLLWVSPWDLMGVWPVLLAPFGLTNCHPSSFMWRSPSLIVVIKTFFFFFKSLHVIQIICQRYSASTVLLSCVSSAFINGSKLH